MASVRIENFKSQGNIHINNRISSLSEDKEQKNFKGDLCLKTVFSLIAALKCIMNQFFHLSKKCLFSTYLCF